MPELPDIVVYLEALRNRVVGSEIEGIRVRSPSTLRTYDPPVSAAEGCRVEALSRLGKRIVVALEGGLALVIHLMISGRLQWRDAGAPIPKKIGLVAFDFAVGTLILTEASTQRRASLHMVRQEDLRTMDMGGVEPLDTDLAVFRAALRRENRTLKRALTDPRSFAGIGNAYSDEILHEARLSPLQRTANLTEAEVERLHQATRSVLAEWIERLLADTGDGWPSKVTGFRPEMAVHGKFGKPCPVCGTPVQRVAGEREFNYCPTCQTGGRILADRATSRFLKGDRPRRVEDL